MQHSDTFDQLSPWSFPQDPEVVFPRKDFEELLVDLDWVQPSAWLDHWLNRGGINLASGSWPSSVRSDWIWGIALPLLSDLERYLDDDDPVLFGISGLPGCGKTTLGRWIEAAACELDWPVSVVSMDDFYLSAMQLDIAMSGNPWNVPRGLPGSHSIELLEETIDSWLKTGNLNSPQFDKSLRNGRGDRCGWRSSRPKILVIEGWFLGCYPTKQNEQTFNSRFEASECLTANECKYRKIIQESLKTYIPIWKKFDRTWHLKSSEFNSTSTWKTEQEMQMQLEKGTSLKGKSLDSFIRMIITAIPQETLQSIDSDVVAIVSKIRKISWVGRTKSQPNFFHSIY